MRGKMYYRFIICKQNEQSGLFHPKEKWNIPKENGLYDVVRKNFSNLNYTRKYQGKTQSWFTEKGLIAFADGIKQLEEFYSLFGIKVIKKEQERLYNIVDEDNYQVWCSK